MLQAFDVWDFDRDQLIDTGAPTGSGITVCVIDTGVHNGHKDFSDGQITGISLIDGETWNEDGYTHGTHVTGSIAANLQGLGLVGVAPEVEIYSVKSSITTVVMVVNLP